MTKKVSRFFIVVSGIMVLLSGCVSQGNYDTVVKERDQLAEKNRTLETELTAVQNEKETATKDLQAAKERINVTNRVIIDSYGKMVDARTKAMTAQELYDRLANKMAAELSSKQITIQQMQSGVSVNLPEAVLFDSGSAVVKQTGETVLSKVGKELVDVPYQTIVGGFTDNVPISARLADKFPSNWDLAAARATSVVRILESAGVPKGRLVAVSLGENQPIASNDTAEGRAQNRRIEIRLRPIVIEQ
jgi:chemotaxis protein MotB